jgi:small subunit ribosomal protein S6
MREYEFTIITRADMPDPERTQVLEKYEALLYTEVGELLKKDDWGVRRFAYPIKKKFRGHYTVYDFAGSDTANLKEAERLLRIDDNVLRYLLVRTRDKIDVEQRREELAKAIQQRQAGENRSED